MAKKNKIVVFSLITLIVVSCCWLDFVFIKENSQFFAEELQKAGETSDVVIVFNSGGYGTVVPEKAYDFKPIIDNLKSEIEKMNFKVAVIPYYRTKETIIGKIGYVKEMFFFPNESKDLAESIKKFIEENPKDKVLLAGLSNGASFVRAAMENLQGMNNVFAIEMGAPFWSEEVSSMNVLTLNNGGKDILSAGDKSQLLFSLIQAPFKWIVSRVEGENISLARALNIPGHQYVWPEVETAVVPFLTSRLLPN
ncbi:MAG TPA: hypothetical protein PLV95_00520 [Candidatus Pacearchaeota archaeon]|nr:hypothetical protein [Candidatus Pacearchaeota archaeon]